jgi:hypothetical protein
LIKEKRKPETGAKKAGREYDNILVKGVDP